MNTADWKLLNPCKDCDRTEVFRHFYTLEGDCRCDDYCSFVSGQNAQVQLLECLIKNGSTYVAREGLKAMLMEIKEEDK